ncbi:zinc finger MYM-type protein 1-like [Cynara cardunculus var. scolymus]|uniref:zinc finger MYM-type protein 1-like n=1 Tax=Cynara cardunculus var. scolymus TaxID=59895 RepID=UPI000D62D06A|nr:zinc finger MYM-type protein 1-like [Cynara cardunculus var. scolymus]
MLIVVTRQCPAVNRRQTAVAGRSQTAVVGRSVGDHYVGQCRSDDFVTDGFNSWNKTERLGLHVGNINSFHYRALKKGEDLMSQDRSIAVAFHKQTEKEKNEHRIRLNALIKTCRFLLKNALPFRGHDESEMSISKGMFLETLALIGDCNEDVVDESSDVSKKEQMTVVLRYVDARGIVRGQGYDGASNIRGEFNGLKALILNKNISAYYIHCFAHQLQLVVVAVVNKHDGVENLFNILRMVINVVNVSYKRKDMLRQSYKDRVQEAIDFQQDIDFNDNVHIEVKARTKFSREDQNLKIDHGKQAAVE